LLIASRRRHLQSDLGEPARAIDALEAELFAATAVSAIPAADSGCASARRGPNGHHAKASRQQGIHWAREHLPFDPSGHFLDRIEARARRSSPDTGGSKRPASTPSGVAAVERESFG